MKTEGGKSKIHFSGIYVVRHQGRFHLDEESAAGGALIIAKFFHFYGGIDVAQGSILAGCRAVDLGSYQGWDNQNPQDDYRQDNDDNNRDKLLNFRLLPLFFPCLRHIWP